MESRVLSQLCMSASLGTRYTDFTVNSKFPANHGSYVQCFSWLKHWTKRFSADFSRSVADLQIGCKWLPTKYTEYTYQRNETVVFPEISTDFVFQNLPEEIQSKIIYFYSVINKYSLHSWDVHFVPSQMVRFWIPPMMLSDRSTHTTWQWPKFVQDLKNLHFQNCFSC